LYCSAFVQVHGIEEISMIRISTRGRYALRAMVDIAQHSGSGPVARQDIARRQEISMDYVAQLFKLLQAANLAEGVKGPGGGYRLTRDAAAITAADIVRAVEGPIAVVDCILYGPDEHLACHRVDRCVAHLLWQRLTVAITGILDSVTLKDLCEEAQQLTQAEA
jgi:Rrf2 family transcriptional regulator, cysteine metabolism repressor